MLVHKHLHLPRQSLTLSFVRCPPSRGHIKIFVSTAPKLLTARPSVPPQASHKESEEALQKRLEEVTRELCRAQTSHASLRADAEKAQEQQQRVAGECRRRRPRGAL